MSRKLLIEYDGERYIIDVSPAGSKKHVTQELFMLIVELVRQAEMLPKPMGNQFHDTGAETLREKMNYGDKH